MNRRHVAADLPSEMVIERESDTCIRAPARWCDIPAWELCPGTFRISATHLNVADIFTKPLDKKLFQAHRDKLFGYNSANGVFLVD